MIIIILSLIIFLFVVQAVFNMSLTYKWRTSLLENFKQKNQRSLSSSPYFYLIVPALREQKVITRLLERLCCLNYDSSNYEIIVALDVKEKKELSQQYTIDVVRKFIDNNKNQYTKVSIVEFSGIGQGRAYQLNTAFDIIKKKSLECKRNSRYTFVGVYDADSYPDQDVLAYIDWRISTDSHITALQQILDYQLNIDEIEQVRFSRLLKANAYYQAAWNGIFEIPRFLRTNSSLLRNKVPTFPPYCMGHGEFIRLDVLIEIGGFSVKGYADGIQLGFALTNKRILIEPIPLFDYCESPTDLTTLIHQHSLWFAGNLQIFRYVYESPESIIVKIIQIYNHIMLNVKWLFRPICLGWLWGEFIVLIINKQTHPIDIIAIAMSTLVIVGYGIFCLYFVKSRLSQDIVIRENMQSKPIYFSLWILMSAGFKSIGAWLGLFRLIKGRLIGRSPKFTKVERV